MVAQQSDMIRRKENAFLAAANSAGIKIFSSFILDEMVSLNTKLLLETIDVINACDQLSPLSAVWQNGDELSFNYECGSCKTADNKTVHFLQVADTADVLQRTVSWLKTPHQL